MKRIAREQARKYAFDWRDEPLLRVPPGESFEVETDDASTGYFRSPDDKAIPAQRPGFDRSPPLANPIAGPIYVEGARRGDTLVVILEDNVVAEHFGPERRLALDVRAIDDDGVPAAGHLFPRECRPRIHLSAAFCAPWATPPSGMPAATASWPRAAQDPVSPLRHEAALATVDPPATSYTVTTTGVFPNSANFLDQNANA